MLFAYRRRVVALLFSGSLLPELRDAVPELKRCSTTYGAKKTLRRCLIRSDGNVRPACCACSHAEGVVCRQWGLVELSRVRFRGPPDTLCPEQDQPSAVQVQVDQRQAGA